MSDDPRKWRDGQAVDIACALLRAHPERYSSAVAVTVPHAKALANDVRKILAELPETIPDEDPPKRVRPVFGAQPPGFA